MTHRGDFDASAVVYGKFTTYRPSTGAPFTLGGTPALSVYKDNSTTQSTTGVTLTADFDSVTGLNHFAIDTSADGTFYSAGSFFDIVITAGTVDGVSVVGGVIGCFTIRKNSALKPATAGRTLVVDAAGLADANVVKVGPTGSGTAQTARDIGASVLLSAGTGTGQLDFTSGVVKANATQWLGGTIPAVNVTGVPLVDAKYLLGTVFSTPTVAGIPNVNAKTWNDLATVALPLVPTTAGRTLDVSAGGEAGLDWANVGSPTTVLALTGTTIAVTQKVDVDTIKTNPVVNAGTITFPNGATLASTTNITAGTITTATNLTNAPTAGDFTATMKTSIGTAVAASAVASVTGNVGGNVVGSVGSVTAAVSLSAGESQVVQSGTALAGGASTITIQTAVGTTADLVGCKIKITSGTGANQERVITGYVNGTKVVTVNYAWVTTPDATSVYTIVFDNAPKIDSSLKISGVVLTDTVTTYTGNTPQTGDAYARLGAPAGASVSADVAAVKVDTAAVKVKTDFLPSATAGAAGGLFIAGTNAATVVTTSFTTTFTGNLTGSVGSVSGAVGSVTGNVGGNVTGSVGSVVGAVGSVTGLTASDVGAIKTQTDKLTFTVANILDSNALRWNGLTTVALPLVPTTAGRTLDVSAGGEAGLDWANIGSPTTVVGLSGTTVKTATDVETDTADIQSRLPAALTGAGNIKADTLAISGDATAADNAESFFDGTGYAGTNNVIPVVSAVTGLTASDVGAIKAKTDSLTFTIANQVDVNVVDWKGATAPAMTGDAFARLGAPAGASVSADIAAVKVDTAAIKLKTDNLPSDPADASDIAGSFSTVNTTLGTIAGYIDTEVGAIKAVTDKLDSTFEGPVGSPANYRFTSDALATAPTGGSAPSAAVIADAVWDEVLSGHAGVGSAGAALSAAGGSGDPWATALPGAYGAGTAGQIIGDNLNATVSSRATQTSVDTIDDFVDTEVAAIKAKTDQLTFTVANQVDSNVVDWKGATAPAMTGDAFARLGAPAGASVSADVAAVKVDTAAITSVPTATQNADALLNRDMAAVSDTNDRSPLQALRFLRNKWDVVGTTLTVRKENDSTSAWTSTVTAAPGADPISGSDPA